MAERPEVLVIGLGAYYRKLRAAIWTYLNPVALVDARAPEDLSLGPEEQPHFKQITKTKQLSTIVSSLSVPSMILTPNSLHTPNVVELASFGGPIFVEKPCAIKMSEIKSLEAVLSCHPSIYFSDFYLDVMSIPLLWFFGKVPLEDWRSNLIEGREQLALFEEIESWRANRIIGRILETDSIHRADWLVDPAQGGVLFDLLIHLLVVLWALFPHDDLVIDQVTLKDISGRNLRSVNLADAGAENYAAVLGHLPSTGTEVLLEVAKNAKESCREFVISADQRFCRMLFAPSNSLQASVFGNSVELRLGQNHYDLVVESFARWLQQGARPYGWLWSKWAIEKILHIKATYRNLPDLPEHRL